MRLKRLILLLVLSAFFLSGCTKQVKSEPDPSVPYNTEGERFVFYRTRQGAIPLSYTKDGVQQIVQGSYWFYQLSGLADHPGEDPYYVYDGDKRDLTGKKEYALFAEELTNRLAK